jgi:hypothetical protein
MYIADTPHSNGVFGYEFSEQHQHKSTLFNARLALFYCKKCADLGLKKNRDRQSSCSIIFDKALTL